MLEDRWQDDFRREFSDNFKPLSVEVGPGKLVVIGGNPQEFYNSVFLRYALYLQGYESERFPLPALLIADRHPEEIKVIDGEINAKVMLFPLEEKYLRPGSVSAFLRELCFALKSEEANKVLERLDKSGIQKQWGWINKYFELKPNFFGFGINVNGILEDALKG